MNWHELASRLVLALASSSCSLNGTRLLIACNRRDPAHEHEAQVDLLFRLHDAVAQDRRDVVCSWPDAWRLWDEVWTQVYLFTLCGAVVKACCSC